MFLNLEIRKFLTLIIYKILITRAQWVQQMMATVKTFRALLLNSQPSMIWIQFILLIAILTRIQMFVI